MEGKRGKENILQLYMSSSVHPNSIVTNSTGTITATDLEVATVKQREKDNSGHLQVRGKVYSNTKATIDQLTGTVKVQYCSTHHNHEGV